MTTKTVLLLGLTGVIVEQAQQQLGMPDLRVLGGTGIDDVRSHLAGETVDHVIMGAGLDLQARLDIVREVLESSETTTVHMKDRLSGKEAFLPFARAVLHGLDGYDV
jgi:hypothetical protein